MNARKNFLNPFLLSSILFVLSSCSSVVKLWPNQESKLSNNTFYVIKEDVDLNGEITIPKNCTLKFRGGKLKNGIIIGQDTKIDAPCSQIFSNVMLQGTFQNHDIWIDWFEGKDRIKENVYLSFKIVRDYIMQKGGHHTIRFNQPEYHYKSQQHKDFRSQVEFVDVENFTIDGCGAMIFLDGQFGPVGSNDLCDESLFQFRSTKQGACNHIEVKNLTIIGNETITYKNTDGNSFGIALRGIVNATVNNCKLSQWGTDGIYVGTGYANQYSSINITISNCEIFNCLRQGISVVGCENNCLIDSCYIHDIKGGSFQNCIDIESNVKNGKPVVNQKNIIIRNCTLENPAKACVCFIRAHQVTFEKNTCINSVSDYPIWLNGDNSDIVINDNNIRYKNTGLYSNGDNTYCVIERNLFEAIDTTQIHRGIYIHCKRDLKTVKCVFRNNIVRYGGIEALHSVSQITNNVFEGKGRIFQTPSYNIEGGLDGRFSNNRVKVDELSLDIGGLFENNEIIVTQNLRGIAISTTALIKNNFFNCTSTAPRRVSLTEEKKKLFINNKIIGNGLIVNDVTK